MAAVDRMSLVVLDAKGRQAAVVVLASTGELRADHVAVSARGDSVVKVVTEGDRLHLR
jgi:hypothetical protein